MNRHRDREKAKLTVRLARCIHVGLCLILLTPLFTWAGFLFPEVTAKVLGFQVLVELVAAGALVLILLEGPSRKQKANPLFSPLCVSLAAFLGYSLFTALVGVDLNRSLWGFIDRQDGLVLLLHFFVWAALMAWFCRREEADPSKGSTLPAKRVNFRFYLYFSYCVSVAVALTALRESEVKLDGVIHPILEVLSLSWRLSGVFGNPLLLGPYLLFHFFWGLYFLGITGKPSPAPGDSGGPEAQPGLGRHVIRYTIMAAVALAEIIIAIVIVAGQSRGAILAMIAGLIFTAGLLVFGLSRSRATKVAGAAFFLCVLLTSVVTWHYRDSKWVSQIPVLQRLTHVSGAENWTTFERLLSWRSGLAGFWDHPLFGWGHDNIYYVLNKYYDPRHVRSSPLLDDTPGLWFDKSHSFFIDLLVERGILGLLAYLLLLGVVATSLYRMSDRRLAICLTGGLIAYLISNAVAFDSFGSLFGFFLTIACIASLSDLKPIARLEFLLARNRQGSTRRKRQPVQPQRRPVFKILLVFALMAAGLYLQVEIAIANHKYAQARSSFTQDAAMGVSLYVEAFGHFSPYAAREKLACASLIVDSVIAKRQASQSFDAGPLVLRLTREALAGHPQDASFYIALNSMYNGLALAINRDFAIQAESFGRKALELSPNQQQAIYNLGRTYVIRNEPGRAVELNKRMLQNADFPLGHWFLGLSLLEDNQRVEAKKEIRKAIDMGYQLNATEVGTLKNLFGEKEFSELIAGK